MVNIFYLDKDPEKCAKYYHDQHVNKILIEITDILAAIHYKMGNTPPRKLCDAIKDNVYPFKWVIESKENYEYCAKLGLALVEEFKYRYKKDKHLCEVPMVWLSKNIPKIKSKGITDFTMTLNTILYHDFFNTDVEASRYAYVDFKCNNKKWTRRGKPAWITKYAKKSSNIIKSSMDSIADDYENNKTVEKAGFSISDYMKLLYDVLFGGKYESKIKQYPKMFSKGEDLLPQLGCAHLLKLKEISNDCNDSDYLKDIIAQFIKRRSEYKKSKTK